MIKLRDYQQEIVNKIKYEFLIGKKSVCAEQVDNSG